MTPSDWMTMLGIALMVGAVVTAVVLWLADGRLRREHTCSLMCPYLHTDVECRIVQDIRTGQWKALIACSAFAVPEHVSCDRECARLANLGLSSYRLARS